MIGRGQQNRGTGSMKSGYNLGDYIRVYRRKTRAKQYNT